MREDGRERKRRRTSPPEDVALSESDASADQTSDEEFVNRSTTNGTHINPSSTKANAVHRPTRNVSPARQDGPGRPASQTGARRLSQPQQARQNGTRPGQLPDPYSTNFFQLQLDDLIERERLPESKYKAAILDVLRRLKSTIESIPETEPQPIAEAEKSLMKSSKVAVPFPAVRPSKDSNYKLQFLKPSNINVVGSYASNLMTKPKDIICVDLLVTMPSSLFQEKDYLDYRYFYRRSYYIACVAAAIKASSDQFDLSFEYLNGNRFQPILVVGTSSALPKSKAVKIKVIPGLSEDTFPKDRILPNRSCVRTKSNADSGTSKEDLGLISLYNGSLLSDSLVTSYLKLFNSISKECSSFKDACILGKAWLQRRGLHSDVTSGGFGNFEWCCLIAVLMESRASGRAVLSPGYSSDQLFRATLQFLALTDLKSGYSTLKSGREIVESINVPCFLDAQRGHNLLYKMSHWSYAILRHEAQVSMASLASATADQFHSNFLANVNQTFSRFDALVEIPLSALSQPRLKDDTEQTRKLCLKLYNTLRKALTDRVRYISIELPKVSGWILSAAPMSPGPSQHIRVGFVVNSANVSRAMDRGPSMDHKKDVKSYLEFWGHEKAVRMKFNNESPIETVKWEVDGVGRSVFEQIVAHVLRRHMGQSVAGAALITADTALPCLSSDLRPLSQGFSGSQSVSTALTTLERDLRALENLPLQIRRISASHALVRHTSLSQPASTLSGSVADVILQFEGSGRWPDDLGAIQRTKAAFLLKLAELFSTAVPTSSAKVGIENGENPILNQSFLDISYTSINVVFRVRIHHDREEALLGRQVKDKFISSLERDTTAKALAKYKQDYIRRPAHTQALQTLCTRFASLSPAIRLTKAWFAAHLLLDEQHISEELVELMVVRTFTQPWPWTAPNSASSAFSRTISWLSEWDWKHEPLIADLSVGESTARNTGIDLVSAGLSSADVSAIRTRFEAWRQLDPAMNRVVLFAATNLDHDGNTWTDSCRPAKVVAARMTNLARAAKRAIDEKGFKVQIKRLFTTELTQFDFVFHMDLNATGRPFTNGAVPFKNLEIQGFRYESDLNESDAVKLYLADLRHLYADAVVFFYDDLNLNVICGLWNPNLDQRRWKPKMHVSTGPRPLTASGASGDIRPEANAAADGTSHDELVEMNKKAVLNEICRLGADLIRNVEIHRDI